MLRACDLMAVRVVTLRAGARTGALTNWLPASCTSRCAAASPVANPKGGHPIRSANPKGGLQGERAQSSRSCCGGGRGALRRPWEGGSASRRARRARCAALSWSSAGRRFDSAEGGR
eukprot:7137793-Prymnesium_polylepis.1